MTALNLKPAMPHVHLPQISRLEVFDLDQILFVLRSLSMNTTRLF